MSRPDFGGISAGDLRHRLTLQRGALGPGLRGKPTVTYATIGTFWACVEPLTGRELFNAQQLKSSTSHRIRMRTVTPVRPSDRFLFESSGRAFEVDSVFRHDEVNSYFEIMATELLSPQ